MMDSCRLSNGSQFGAIDPWPQLDTAGPVEFRFENDFDPGHPNSAFQPLPDKEQYLKRLGEFAVPD